MIMRPGQQLLLPANPLFIWSTLLFALLLNMLQNMGLWGRAAWVPDLLALVLVFWSVHQPLRVGIGTAFVFGIFMDEPRLLPPDYQALGADKNEQARKVADYIAGMTDRYAMREYRRLFAVDEI